MATKHFEDRPEEGRFAYEGLDRTIHERGRLSILTSLLSHPRGIPFTDLKRLCALTDGNLSRHLSLLEQNGLVQVRKEHSGGRPQTLCVITGSGRRRFLEYLATLEQVVKDAEEVEQRTSGNTSSLRTAPA